MYVKYKHINARDIKTNEGYIFLKRTKIVFTFFSETEI